MKKFKTRKEILTNPETRILLFEFFQEMELLEDHVIEYKIDDFIDRKLKHCKIQGV